MSYINAQNALPEWLIDEIRSRVGDGLLYIPPAPDCKRAWGSLSGARRLLEQRNQAIRESYRNGASVTILAKEYCLSEETIKKIIYKT